MYGVVWAHSTVLDKHKAQYRLQYIDFAQSLYQIEIRGVA